MPQYMRQGYGKMLIDFSEYLWYICLFLELGEMAKNHFAFHLLF